MKPLRTILTVISLAVLLGCQDIVLPSYAPQIVVEGWIENGGFPVVILTTTVPVNESVKDSSDLKNHIIRWGKVSISDGEKEVILSGRKDERFFPPYIYTTSKLKGEVGKTYHLKVEYSGRTVTALTTIPAPKPLEYIKINESRSNGAQDDGRYFLTGGLKDDRTTKDYYKVFTKVHQKDSIFVSSFLGLTDDTILGEGIEEIPINRGSGVQTTNKDNYYRSGDIVHIRFCTLDKIAWEYWSDFEEIQSLSRNPFFPISTDIRSNISGGLGYWAGYGATYYTISITPSE